MAWKSSTVMEERYKFVLMARETQSNMSELCRSFGISRECGYKWLRRYEHDGLDGLKDRCRRPMTIVTSLTHEVITEVVRLRYRHRHWGGRKIRAWLINHGHKPVPAVRTIDRFLAQCGMVIRKHRKKRKSLPSGNVVQATHPNHVWTVDFKGEWRTLEGTLVYPLTVRDEFSRKILAVEILTRRTTEAVKPIFTRLFSNFGLPEFIRSDNGQPFACIRALCGLTSLAVWWLSLGIIPNRIPPASPQFNPSHERMHGDMMRELQSDPAQNPQQQQREADIWVKEYNCERPHQALGDTVPEKFYRSSSRKYYPDLDGAEYDYPQRFQTRRVFSSGEMEWRGKRIFFSKALARRTVGIETINRNRINIWFNEFLLASTNIDFSDTITEHCLTWFGIKDTKKAA